MPANEAAGANAPLVDPALRHSVLEDCQAIVTAAALAVLNLVIATNHRPARYVAH